MFDSLKFTNKYWLKPDQFLFLHPNYAKSVAAKDALNIFNHDKNDDYKLEVINEALENIWMKYNGTNNQLKRSLIVRCIINLYVSKNRNKQRMETVSLEEMLEKVSNDIRFATIVYSEDGSIVDIKKNEELIAVANNVIKSYSLKHANIIRVYLDGLFELNNVKYDELSNRFGLSISTIHTIIKKFKFDIKKYYAMNKVNNTIDTEYYFNGFVTSKPFCYKHLDKYSKNYVRETVINNCKPAFDKTLTINSIEEIDNCILKCYNYIKNRLSKDNTVNKLRLK